MDSARLTIDLDALAHNHAFLRARAGGAEIAPVVKADGYGLGAAPVAQRLWAEGARTFYVARVFEGEALRQALPDALIYVFDGYLDGARLEAANLRPVLNSREQIDAWRAERPRLPAALHIDTGMNRLGVRIEEADALKDLPIDLVLSHLACAPTPEHPLNALQQQRFSEVRRLFPNAKASFANSAGVFLGPDYHFDQCRPGVSLYGGGPREVPHPGLQAVATLEAPILQVRDLPAGESVGYGAAFVAERPMTIATVAAGYADGIPRASHPRGKAHVAGETRNILGRISMDLLAVDVTALNAKPGDPVELLGPHILVDEAAAASGTTAYERLTSLRLRAQRVLRHAR
ncbi:MAG TPA: alanine racemase [Caulobacteraceae bacterium]